MRDDGNEKDVEILADLLYPQGIAGLQEVEHVVLSRARIPPCPDLESRQKKKKKGTSTQLRGQQEKISGYNVVTN